MKTSTKIISFLIIISLCTYVKADSNEEECDAICELFWDIASFIAGMMWRACMDSPECRMVAIPTVFGLFVFLIAISLIMKCIYGDKYDKKYEYEGPNPRRVVAFGAGYICG